MEINMVEENISWEFRQKNLEEISNYFIKKLNQNRFLSKKHKNVYAIHNYIEYLLILASAVTGCVSISAFTSLVGILIGIASSVIGKTNCAITAGIKSSQV